MARRLRVVEFEYEKRLLVANCHGVLELDDVIQAAYRAAIHPLYDPSNNVLISLREVEHLRIERDDASMLVERFTASRKDRAIRVAVVASDDYHFGIARMIQFHSLSASGECQAFRDLFLARAWLVDAGGLCTDHSRMRKNPDV